MFISFRNVDLIDESAMRAIAHHEWNMRESRTFSQLN